MIDRLLDVATVARRLGVSDCTVRLWVRLGKVPEAQVSHTGRIKIPSSVLVRLRKTKKSVTNGQEIESPAP